MLLPFLENSSKKPNLTIFVSIIILGSEIKCEKSLVLVFKYIFPFDEKNL